MEVERIYRRAAVEGFAGLRRSALYDAIARGQFPRPVRVSKRCVGWLQSDLITWQAARIAERDQSKSLRQPDDGHACPGSARKG